jgi:hypothetical protein
LFDQKSENKKGTALGAQYNPTLSKQETFEKMNSRNQLDQVDLSMDNLNLFYEIY